MTLPHANRHTRHVSDSDESASQLLVGAELYAVEFIRDYLRLHFHTPQVDATLTVLTIATMADDASDAAERSTDPRAMIRAIGATVRAAAIQPGKLIELGLEDGRAIRVSLANDDLRGGFEAARLDAGERWWVW